MTAAVAGALAGSNMPKEVTGGNAGPSTSGSNGQFWTDMTNGDFIVGGKKDSWVTIVAFMAIGILVWLLLKKK